MGKKKKFVVVLVVFLSTALPFCTFGQMDGADRKREVYEKQLNHIIACCESKMQMSNSKHHHICKTGKLSLKKADFCTNNKRALIDEMILMNLPPKEYKINYYVNTKFFEFERNNLEINRDN